MKRTAIALAIVALLAGCGTLDGKMENRVTTTLACDRAFYTSLFGPIGITGEIDKRDLEQMPCAARDKPVAPPAPPAASVPTKRSAAAK